MEADGSPQRSPAPVVFPPSSSSASTDVLGPPRPHRLTRSRPGVPATCGSGPQCSDPHTQPSRQQRPVRGKALEGKSNHLQGGGRGDNRKAPQGTETKDTPRPGGQHEVKTPTRATWSFIKQQYFVRTPTDKRIKLNCNCPRNAVSPC